MFYENIKVHFLKRAESGREPFNHVCKWIGAKVLEDIEIHQNFQNNPQPKGEEFYYA